jgi:hypothetical protein
MQAQRDPLLRCDGSVTDCVGEHFAVSDQLGARVEPEPQLYWQAFTGRSGGKSRTIPRGGPSSLKLSGGFLALSRDQER